MRTLLSVFAILLSSSVMAGEFYVLDLDGQQMKAGQGQDTIKIKRLMRQQHSGVDLQGADLISVMMVAKTRKGRGSAQLLVGGALSSSQGFGGTPSGFNTDGEMTYDRHIFVNETGNSQGRWQMKLRGNFKISQMVVEIGDSAQAVVLDYAHTHMKVGQAGGILKLKREANQQHGLQLSDYELEGVTLVAKTRKGRGTAQLIVGGASSVAEDVFGQPQAFHNDADWTYDSIYMENPSFDSHGRWQIQLKGNFKIKEVVLHLKKK